MTRSSSVDRRVFPCVFVLVSTAFSGSATGGQSGRQVLVSVEFSAASNSGPVADLRPQDIALRVDGVDRQVTSLDRVGDSGGAGLAAPFATNVATARGRGRDPARRQHRGRAGVDSRGRRGAVDADIRVELPAAGPVATSGMVLGTQTQTGFTPRLQFTAADPTAAAYLEVYGAPCSALSGVLELAATEAGPAIVAGTAQASAVDQSDACISSARSISHASRQGTTRCGFSSYRIGKRSPHGRWSFASSAECEGPYTHLQP